jgi:2-alkenal reductase
MTKKQILFVSLVLIISILGCQISFTDAPPTVQPETNQILPTAAPVTQLVVPTPAAPPPAVNLNSLTEVQDVLVSIFNNVNEGVVAIRTATDLGEGLGSGFVYDKQGHIVTNFHVVEGASEIEVDFPSGMKVRGAVIGADLDSDLAVVKVDVPEDKLVPLSLGDSNALQIGHMVVAIGNPFGLSSTMTLGIVSAKGRTLSSIRQTEEGRFFSAGDLIQTDTSINPGNSGGPLLNLEGEVIGINRAIQTTGTNFSGEPINSGIGFAISVNIVKRVIPGLIESGFYDYPYLGLSAREELTLFEQEALGIEQTTGAYVVEVVQGGPADSAGIQGGTILTDIPGLPAGGDLIIAVDGQPVRVFGDLLSYLMTSKSPGDTISLSVIRRNRIEEVTVILGKRPDN